MRCQLALSDEQLTIQELARRFNAERITPFAAHVVDHAIERLWRDLRVHSILEGTNQVMRMIVGRDLLRP